MFKKITMFSQGQLIFSGLFVLAFVIFMVISYRKDKKLHKKYYKGSIFVLVAFICFIALLFVIKSIR